MIQTILIGILCICELIRLGLDIATIRIVPPRKQTAPPPSPLQEEDPVELARQRRRFDEEMEAFQQMLNYNSDVAYGIERKESK